MSISLTISSPAVQSVLSCLLVRDKMLFLCNQTGGAFGDVGAKLHVRPAEPDHGGPAAQGSRPPVQRGCSYQKPHDSPGERREGMRRTKRAREDNGRRGMRTMLVFWFCMAVETHCCTVILCAKHRTDRHRASRLTTPELGQRLSMSFGGSKRTEKNLREWVRACREWARDCQLPPPGVGAGLSTDHCCHRPRKPVGR